MPNCGLEALEQFTKLQSISMFTLIHMARDNGLNLYFCKVEPDELALVARPAIFHQNNHFVFVKNGEAMPAGDYDGYVLTQKPLHEPLPYSLAKKIKGEKDTMGFIQPIAIGLASMVNPVLGALVGAGLGGATAAGAFGDKGEGEWWRIATGGLSGYTALSNPMLSGISAAVGELPGAIKSGNYMSPLTAGLTQYGVGALGNNLQSSGGLSGLFGLGSSSPTKGASTLATGGLGGVDIAQSSASIPTPTGYGGTYTVPGIGSSVVGIPGQGPAGLSGAASLAGSAATPGSSGFNFSNMLNSGNLTKLLGAGLATSVKAPEYDAAPMEDNFSRAAEALGQDNYKQLPQATRDQLNKYVGMSIEDLSSEFYMPDDKGLRQLEESKQKAIDNLTVTYANYGQDPYSSTQAQQQLTDINRQYDQAVAEYQQQLQNQATSNAIQFKQDILAKSMEQGAFDYETAMELATYMGLQDQYRYALSVKDYDTLQNVLAQIFNLS